LKGEPNQSEEQYMAIVEGLVPLKLKVKIFKCIFVFIKCRVYFKICATKKILINVNYPKYFNCSTLQFIQFKNKE